MSDDTVERVRNSLDAIYRAESRRILATLIRLLGDFDLAEDALQDALRAALESWQKDGVPSNPYAWLVSTGRFRAIDAIRRRARFDASVPAINEGLYGEQNEPRFSEEDGLEDDRLRLIFTCCHPALTPEARVALTLREVCGLTTEEIARALFTTPATLAQRIVRAKAKIREARIPYQVPEGEELPKRLETVLQVIYLVFNEGYSAVERTDLAGEAIRLGRLLLELLPATEVAGLLALMLLQESRRAARTSPDGELILLEDQDRSLWNQEMIAEGRALAAKAMAAPGPYALQAAIAAVHADKPDWTRVVALYDELLRFRPWPVVELNRAVAVAMRDGAEAGLEALDRIFARGDLRDYHLAHATRADFYRRLRRPAEARASYERARSLAREPADLRFLEKRIRELN